MTLPFIIPAAGPFTGGHDLHDAGRKVARFGKREDAELFLASEDLVKALQLMLGATDPLLEAADKPAYINHMRQLAQAALDKANRKAAPAIKQSARG